MTDQHDAEPTQVIPAKDGDIEVPIPSRVKSSVVV
jgi:hypothetical protein